MTVDRLKGRDRQFGRRERTLRQGGACYTAINLVRENFNKVVGRIFNIAAIVWERPIKLRLL